MTRFGGSTDQTRARLRSAVSDRSSNTMSEITPAIVFLIAAPLSRSFLGQVAPGDQGIAFALVSGPRTSFGFPDANAFERHGDLLRLRPKLFADLHKAAIDGCLGRRTCWSPP